MATKRITASTVDWLAFAQKVPKGQLPQFNAFKAKSDGYVMKVAGLPESIAPINWSLYEERVKVPGLVADFRKQYEALTVPYPKDVYSGKVEEQQKTAMAEVAQFVKNCNASIEDMKLNLAKLTAMRPMEEMTMEEFFDFYPDQALDPFDRPTMWPHEEDYQPEYLEKMDKEGKFDEEH